MRRLLPVVAAAGFCAAPFAAGAAEAVYTDLNLDACEVERVFDEGGGADLRCPGLGDIPVLVSEGDLRFDVDFGASNGRFDTFAPFNSLGEQIEWRIEGDNPFAAILRFRIEMPGGEVDPSGVGQVLAVAKVGSPDSPGCPVAYVDALLNRDANLIARQVADAFARAFRCGIDRPTYVGATGPLSGSASATRPGEGG